MGNWHCIPSSCAEVVYQEYEPPKIRWRYPGENWQEKEADDYSVSGYPQFPQTQPKAYRIWAKAEIISRVPPPPDTKPPQPIRYAVGQEIFCTVNTFFQSPIWLVKPITNSSGSWLWEVTHTPTVGGNQFRGNCVKQTIAFPVGTPRSNGGLESLTSQANTVGPGVSEFYDWYLVEDKTVTLRECINQQTFECTFKVFKQGQIVHQETRSVCPEVEKLPCRLSPEIKRIEIEKSSYLDRIEVRDQSINTVFVSPLEAPLIDTKSLPNHCLNLYKTYVLAPPILSNFVPLPGFINPYQFVAQICSAPGCPPPQYQILCDSCGCESCPDNTCPIECNGNICCYNDYGVSIKEIPLSNYCGGTT